MITNLFSSFDPSTNILSINWLSRIMPLIMAPFLFWLLPSRLNIIWIKITKILNNEIKVLTPNKESKGIRIFIIRLFIIIIINNFMGLFPYIFTRTSHISVTLRLALPIWLSFIIYGWVNKTINIFAHLVPQGTPPVLIPFIVCIETIRNIIRPGTLAVRLSANIIAGHLLITLLGRVGPMIPATMVNLLIIVQILLLVLEISVSIIQAYVFIILTTLYSREVN